MKFMIVPMPEDFPEWPKPAKLAWLGLFSFVHWTNGRPAPKGCFPTLPTLQAETGLSRPTIRRGLRLLKEKGHVDWYRDKNGLRYFTFPTLEGEPAPVMPPTW